MYNPCFENIADAVSVRRAASRSAIDGSGFADERGTENLRLFLRHAWYMQDMIDVHMRAMVPVRSQELVKKIIDLSL